MQDGAFHARHELDDACFANILNEPVDDGVAELAVGHLAAAEAKAGLDFVALVKEAYGLILLGLVVVLVNGDGELDFLDDDDLLALAGGALALFLLVEITAVVLNAADGGNCVGRNFDQIQSALAGNFQRLERRQNAELFAVFINYADFTRANTVVDTDKGLSRTLVECDGAPPIVARCPSAQARERTLSIALARLPWIKELGRFRPGRDRNYDPASDLGIGAFAYFPITSMMAVPERGTAAW